MFQNPTEQLDSISDFALLGAGGWATETTEVLSNMIYPMIVKFFCRDFKRIKQYARKRENPCVHRTVGYETFGSLPDQISLSDCYWVMCLQDSQEWNLLYFHTLPLKIGLDRYIMPLGDDSTTMDVTPNCSHQLLAAFSYISSPDLGLCHILQKKCQASLSEWWFVISRNWNECSTEFLFKPW